MNLRARRATVYIVAAGLLALASCGREYTWTRKGPPASRVEWRHVEPWVMYAMCARQPEDYPNLGGCAVYALDGGHCTVYSRHSEEVARRLMSGDGLTLYEHEVGDTGNPNKHFGHCNGWVHNEPDARTTGKTT